MIITLGEAIEIDMEIDEDDLAAFETSVREITNNNFQNIHLRHKNIEFVEKNIILVKEPIIGFRIGDTIEVNYSIYNDGLFVIKKISETEITVEGTPFLVGGNRNAMITVVQYPADIKKGIKRLIEYDKKMSGKLGIKSETVSRMSTTYYDVNATENTDGYPASLLSFLNKYEKMRW